MAKNMTVSQKKILIIVGAGIFTFLIFLLFIYLPTQATLKRLKAQLAEIEAQQQEVEIIASGGKTIEEGIRLLKERYNTLNGYFPVTEEETLKLIINLAKDMKVDIDSIEPREKVIFVDENNTAQQIEGKTCYKIPVSMKMRCSYKDFVGYTEALRKSLAAFITVEKLQIEKNHEDVKKLNIYVEINVYLLA
ncbi:MAG: hypothetical protein Q8O30_07715 [Candidatus Omnitrophota bacterium]|nr:hypothetical protein [Candidatus Omnitrophota bacterium]